MQHPDLAEDEKILATPTLIKRLPPPLRRVIGDLSDREKVLLGLDLRADAPLAGEAPSAGGRSGEAARGAVPPEDPDDDPDNDSDRRGS